MTLITQVKENSYFIDEQKFGPYSFWHHKHFFEATPTGTKMTDVVHYGLPLDFRTYNEYVSGEKQTKIHF
jgi:ligand-binding SRPBCC domain-containing protein